jgi:hypothetical protein
LEAEPVSISGVSGAPARYGNVEQLMGRWLEGSTQIRTVSELPATLPDKVIQVVRFGGGRPEFPFDIANVDVDCYATTRQAANDLAEDVASRLMYDLPGQRLFGVLFVSVECLTAPSWAPYDNTTVRRMTAAYQVRTQNPI